MKTLVANKTFIKLLAAVLSVLLVVALVPQIQIAYSDPEAHLDGIEQTDLAGTGEDEPDGDVTDDAAVNENDGDETNEPDGTEETNGGDVTDQTTVVEGDDEEDIDEEALAAWLAENGGIATLAATANPTNENGYDTSVLPVTTSQTITLNGTFDYKHIFVSNGATLTINGVGTINAGGTIGKCSVKDETGNVKERDIGSVILVEGENTKLILDGDITITGGSGTKVNSEKFDGSDDDGNPVKAVGGGGILVQRDAASVRGEEALNYTIPTGASLEIKSNLVKITGNEAISGGGIFVDRYCKLMMEGGEVYNNTATVLEGGGIWIGGGKKQKAGEKTVYEDDPDSVSYISAGHIYGNSTNTTFAWGGGGIFIESKGVLQIPSTRITNNKANGLGGGVAGCPHADIGIGTLDESVAIYRNEANKKAEPTNVVLHSLKVKVSGEDRIVGDKYAYGDDGYGGQFEDEKTFLGNITNNHAAWGREKFTDELAEDFYCLKGTHISGVSLSDEATGPVWEGIKWSKDTPANPAEEEYKLYIDGYYENIGESVGLTHWATKKENFDKTLNIDLSKQFLVIERNYSGTHGGGIGCNGELFMGTIPEDEKAHEPLSISFNKNIVNNVNADKNISLGEETFDFTLTRGDNIYHGKYMVVDDKTAKITFNIDKENLEQSGDIAFKLNEELTDAQVKQGYQALFKDVDVFVHVDVTEVPIQMPAVNKVLKVYKPEVTTVNIGGVALEANEDGTFGTFTNVLNLETSVSLPVDKTAVGVSGTYSFDLKQVTAVDGAAVSDQNKPNDAAPDRLTTESVAGVDPIDLTVDGTNVATTSPEKSFSLSYQTPGTYWYVINETNAVANNQAKNDTRYDETTYLVKVDVSLNSSEKSLNTNVTKWRWSLVDKKFQEYNAEASSFTNVAVHYNGFDLQMKKRILNKLGNLLGEDVETGLDERAFSFKLTEVLGTDEEGNVSYGRTYETTTDKTTGAATFIIDDTKYVEEAWKAGESKTYVFSLHEVNANEKDKEDLEYIDDAEYMEYIDDVEVTITLHGVPKVSDFDAQGKSTYEVDTVVDLVTIGDDRVPVDGDMLITNRYVQNGTWSPEVGKYYYGEGAPTFNFTMTELAFGPSLIAEDGPLAADAPTTVPTIPLPSVWKGHTEQYEGNYSKVKFADVQYLANHERDDRGDHWYLIAEDGIVDEDGVPVAGMDSTVYILHVVVAEKSETENKVLIGNVVEVFYADDMEAFRANEVYPVADRNVTYVNTDYDMSMASFSVYAASGEALDRICYVDPKIVKNLEGRAIKTNEFSFELREVPQADGVVGFYGPNGELVTDGPVISATSNDEFGMVDFDKAADKTGNLENPSCLEYSSPGTYYYIVVEADETKDASVLYNPAGEVITFTTEIREVDGQLKCVDMYYGHLVDGENVRYNEQYVDYNGQDNFVGSFDNLNSNWHPTITNVAKPIDLKVRKTSASDRTEGLEGATYALYMVNDNKEGDVQLDTATSGADGWITFENVSLTENVLYYFKEIAAPAGHTVSEFRSAYFKVVETKDEAGTTYYQLAYQDTKYAASDAANDVETVDAVTDTEGNDQPLASLLTQGDEASESAAPAGATFDKDADKLVLVYNRDGGVYDEVTDVSFNKLDTRTHEWVSGAKLAIIEKDSGNEVVSWVSGNESKQVQKTLNVGTTYILRELEAPANYSKANDVEFVIDTYGKVKIISGDANGNADLSDSTITLYDTMLDAEEVVTEDRENVREEQGESERVERTNIIQRLAQTGDPALLVGVAAVAIASAAVMMLAANRRRKLEEE